MTDINTLSDRDIIQILQNQNIHLHGIYMKLDKYTTFLKSKK